jgi:hypothetical protein
LAVSIQPEIDPAVRSGLDRLMRLNAETLHESARLGREIRWENLVSTTWLVLARVVEHRTQPRSDLTDRKRGTFKDADCEFASRHEPFNHHLIVELRSKGNGRVEVARFVDNAETHR